MEAFKDFGLKSFFFPKSVNNLIRLKIVYLNNAHLFLILDQTMQLFFIFIIFLNLASGKNQLLDDFNERVVNFLFENLNSTKCDIWIDVLRLEFGVEEHFCRESFIEEVC